MNEGDSNSPFVQFGLKEFRSRSPGVTEFSKQLQRFALSADRKAKVVIRGVATTLVTNVIEGGAYSPGTPVKSGLAKSSWFTALNSESDSEAVKGFHGADYAGVDVRAVISRNSLAEAVKRTSQMKIGDRLRLIGAVPYMWRLEFGWSQQAPNGMVRLAFSSIGMMIREQIAIARSS